MELIRLNRQQTGGTKSLPVYGSVDLDAALSELADKRERSGFFEMWAWVGLALTGKRSLEEARDKLLEHVWQGDLAEMAENFHRLADLLDEAGEILESEE